MKETCIKGEESGGDKVHAGGGIGVDIYIYIYEDNLVQESTDDLIEDNIDEGWEIK